MDQGSGTGTLTVSLPGGGSVSVQLTAGDVAYVPPPPATRAVGVHDVLIPLAAKSRYPGVGLTREFAPGGVLNTPGSLITRYVTACGAALAAGLSPIFSVKLDRAQVAAGQWDKPVHDLAQYMASRRGANKLAFWQEPENDMPAADYVAMFNRLATHAKSAYADLQVVYPAMAYQWAPNAHRTASVEGKTDNPDAWAAVQADIFAIDVYSGKSFPVHTILPDHPGFRRWQDTLVKGRPYMVAERGFIATAADWPVRAQAIAREAEWLASTDEGRRCTGYVYWNTTGTENNPLLPLDVLYGVQALAQLVSALTGQPTRPAGRPSSAGGSRGRSWSAR
jgi:hypothetical protein